MKNIGKIANFTLYTPNGVVKFDEVVTEDFDNVVEKHRQSNPESSVNYFIDRDNWGGYQSIQMENDEKALDEGKMTMDEYMNKYYPQSILPENYHEAMPNMKNFTFIYSVKEDKTEQKKINVIESSEDKAYALFIGGLTKPATLVICETTKRRII